MSRYTLSQISRRHLLRVLQLDNSSEQHSAIKTIVLHLYPGLLYALFYVVLVPPARKFHVSSYAVLVLGVLFIVVPTQLIPLLWLGYRRNGRPSLNGIVLFRVKLRAVRMVTIVAIIFSWAALVSFLLGWVNEYLLHTVSRGSRFPCYQRGKLATHQGVYSQLPCCVL